MAVAERGERETTFINVSTIFRVSAICRSVRARLFETDRQAPARTINGLRSPMFVEIGVELLS